MKIYFGFTVVGDRSSIDTARNVVHQLEEMGHEVLTRHLVSDNAWEADRSISPQDVYRRDMDWLEQWKHAREQHAPALRHNRGSGRVHNRSRGQRCRVVGYFE